ncbi:MAG: MaoC family dehydratase N-terminal domain-containing protein [Dehalococcoidia bacterium]
MPQLTDYHRGLIGSASEPREIPHSINRPMADHWCEMVEDANPIYHDEAYARGTWLQGTIAPPTMLLTWNMRPVWPEAVEEGPLDRLGLPGCDATIAVNATQEYFQPLRYGDRIWASHQIAAISEEKTTRLGNGHFVTLLTSFTSQAGTLVGTHQFRLFVYGPHAEAPG